MKKLFVAIRKNDFDTVKHLIKKKPELIECVAKQPPKKDDGQSPLQVSLKTGKLDIADYLIELGADINFIESESCNEWKAPVIHDAINAAVMCSRWNVNSELYGGIKVFHSKAEADRAFQTLQKIVDLGADVNAVDSYGNSCLCRASLQARQILPSFNYTEKKLSDDRILTKELETDLTRIFDLLFEYGANIDYIVPNFGYSLKEMYKDEPLERFLRIAEKFS